MVSKNIAPTIILCSLSLIPLHLTTGGNNIQQYLKVISKFTEHALGAAFIQHSDYLVCSACSGKYNKTSVLVEAAVQLMWSTDLQLEFACAP